MKPLDIGQKIKQLREKNQLTLEQVGNLVGVGKSTVRKWETGIIANMRQDKIAKLAAALHTTPAYLMGWTDEMTDALVAENLFRIETKKIPMLGNIACGEPILASEKAELYVEANIAMQADFCLRCKGDSMINARIHDGDIVFIRKQSMVENGEIAAVIIENEATLKRVYYYPEQNMTILKPENPNYAPLIYSGKALEEVRIIGKAIAFQSDLI